MKDTGNFTKLLHKLDFFGEVVPGFVLRGKSKVTSSTGSVASIVMIILTFLFALLKLKHLVSKSNPFIGTNTEAVSEGATFSSGSENFMIAFGA